MAVAQRVSGPYVGMGTGDNCMDRPMIIREQEEQQKYIGPHTVSVAGHVAAAGRAKRGNKPLTNSGCQSLRYDIHTLFHIASAQPPMPRYKLQFSDSAPVEVIPWKAFEPRHFNMPGYAASVASDDDDLTGGVTIHFQSNAPTKHRATSSSQRERPIRQPRGPPDSVKAQIEQGFQPQPPTGEDAVRVHEFAKWIRDHSSPRSNRVTAGGRIVPVGPKSPPPTFHMDFIDRIIQAAEATKQDTSLKHGSRTIDWLIDPRLSLPADSASDGGSSSVRNGGAPAQSPSPPHSLGVHEDGAGKVRLPEKANEVGTMADGSKICMLGSQYLRAYVNKHGETQLELLEKSEEPREMPRMVPEPCSPDLDMPDGVWAVASDPRMFVRGADDLVYPTMPTFDEQGNMSFIPISTMGYRLVPSFAPAEGGRVESALSNAAATMPNPGSALMPMPSLMDMPVPAQQPIPEMPLTLANKSRNELIYGYEQSAKALKFAQSELKDAEVWLAKDEEIMQPELKHDLIAKKGELIPRIDYLRKDVEKYQKALEALDSSLSLEERSRRVALPPQQPPAYAYRPTSASGLTYGHDMLDRQLSATSAFVHHAGNPIINVTAAPDSIPVASGATASVGSLSSQPRSTQSMVQMMAPSSWKPDAPTFVPSFHDNNGQGSSVRGARSVMHLGNSDNSYKSALVRLNSRESSEGSSEARSTLTVSKPATRKSNSSMRISIRRPDGTPVNFEDLQSSGTHSHERHTSTLVSLAPKSSAGSTQETSSIASAVPSKEATKSKSGSGPTWTRLPGEDEDSFKRRLQHQRDVMHKPKHSSADHALTASNSRKSLSNSIPTNENLHLKPSSQSMTPKMPSNSSFGTRQNPAGHTRQPTIPMHPDMTQGHVIHAGQALYPNLQLPIHGRVGVPTSSRSMVNMMSSVDLNTQPSLVFQPSLDVMQAYYTSGQQTAIPYQQYRAHRSGRLSPHP